MLTSPHTNNNSTNMSPELEADLAAYGILRKTAEKEAGDAEFFGMKDKGNKTVLKFNADIETLQDEGMTVSVVAPQNETFNMLLTTDFNKAVKTATTDDLRAYLRKLLRKV